MLKEYDVAIVGAGPAGTTTAGLLAKQGYRVLVIEREKFPRYHIGESLVPGVLPVLQELGLSDQVARYGFIDKYGITLLWGKLRDPWTTFFGEVGPFEHSYQVVRSEFDYLMLQHARRLGATVLEETPLVDFVFEGDRCTGIAYSTANGTMNTVRARYVVDASGQSSLLARKLKLVQWDEDLKNVAIWAYYQGGRTLDGKYAGNILVENMLDGWLWDIPLHDGTHSVGWVTRATNVNGREDLERSYRRMIDSSLETRRLLAEATRVSGFRTARDWSYKSKRFWGPGFLLAGDAAGFVDPLFSTGVFLAMNGGSLAAKILSDALQHPERELELLARYDETYKNFLDVVISFVRYFYDASLDKEMYWDHARTLIDPLEQMSARQDFVYLISGLHGIRSVMSLERQLTLGELECSDETRTPRELFNELRDVLEHEPHRTVGLTALYQFDISGEQGGKWYVDIIDGKAKICEGQAANPGCTIVMQDSDYVAMATGRLRGSTAFMTGKLRAQGDIALAMKANSIFG